MDFFGIFDPASEHFNIKAHKEDFGQTLGYWGVGSGPHIVIPFYGPSNLRDLFGRVGDEWGDLGTAYLSQRDYNLLENSDMAIRMKILSLINSSPELLKQYQEVKKDALDLYPFLRDVYEQKRKKEIEE